jgi:hypothetical protein
MKNFKLLLALLIAGLIVLTGPVAWAEQGQNQSSDKSIVDKRISRKEAVALAERFIRVNGYADAPESELKSQLDLESIEWSNNRQDLLKQRRNTLRPVAVGIKAIDGAWGVVFDYVSSEPGRCRVVTMSFDGTNIRVQHKDGIREYWVGHDDK